MNYHKRSCCSTWVPRKINMEFANDSGKIFSIREEWPFVDEGVQIKRHLQKKAQPCRTSLSKIIAFRRVPMHRFGRLPCRRGSLLVLQYCMSLTKQLEVMFRCSAETLFCNVLQASISFFLPVDGILDLCCPFKTSTKKHFKNITHARTPINI